MNSYHKVLSKLQSFTRKYYTKQLLQGALLFVALGIFFWLAITSLELLLWLNQDWRLTLFLIFIVVKVFLLYRFICIPLFYLFKIKRGLSNKEASKLIGKHFPKVEDKLFNLLELAESPGKSELLEASIEQRSTSLSVLPFVEAINLKESAKYAKYLVIPVVILGLFWISGNIQCLFNSHKRVVNYDLAYERPAPFTFNLLNSDLSVLDNEPLIIEFAIDGDLVPENASMILEGEPLLMRREGNRFSYTMQPPVDNATFYISANGWDSRSFQIESIKTPTLIDFSMSLRYPRYLNKTDEVIVGGGNAIVPEGTQIEWEIKGNSVDEIKMSAKDSVEFFTNKDAEFVLSKRLYSDLDYAISTSNDKVKDFESLQYAIDVVKDATPTIEVSQVLDSIDQNQSFYSGQLSDDYGLGSIRLFFYPVDDEKDKKSLVLENLSGNVHQFYYTFPSGIEVEKGQGYKLYFEVVDNDGLRGGKKARSKVFTTQIYDDNSLKNRKLEFQDNVIKKFDESIKEYKEQQETLSKINEKQKEGNTFNFEEKNRIKDFLQKQKEQELLMEKFTEQLNESLDKSNSDDNLKKLLQERLERQELEARRNEKLLEELNKLADKIEKEELKKKLDELSKKQSSNARNLEQILELTKRYYVTEKVSQISKELSQLSEKQDALAKQEENKQTQESEKSIDKQKELNKDFEKVADDLDELRKDNEDLKKPIEIEVDKKDEDSIKQDQQEALEELEKKESSKEEDSEGGDSKPQKKQKSAAQKLKEMSESLAQSAAAGGGSSDTEDAEMLRQILDNLVTFSFKQEQLFEWVEESDVDVSQYGKMVRDQKELRGLFEHVDDSLFSLSLRRAELSEFVNEQITEVYYNIDKSLESLAENQVFQGASYQQYVINATNSLSDFLANILDNMQQNMQPGQGQGEGSGFQLPDIIKGQEGLQQKMNSSGQQEGESNKSEGDEGENEGEGGKEGGEQSGKDENGEGKQRGKEGGNDGEGGNGNTIGEEEIGFNEIYEIYKEQQFLREQLENQLKNLIETEDRELAKKLLRQMEDFENDLIENGITQRTKDKANVIQHQLLKLKNASLKQGELKERESDTNLDKYKNPIITKPEQLIDNRNDVEILNRQALPLRRQYDRKVKEYFKND